jgi:hypothetical protein
MAVYGTIPISENVNVRYVDANAIVAYARLGTLRVMYCNVNPIAKILSINEYTTAVRTIGMGIMSTHAK